MSILPIVFDQRGEEERKANKEGKLGILSDADLCDADLRKCPLEDGKVIVTEKKDDDDEESKKMQNLKRRDRWYIGTQKYCLVPNVGGGGCS